MRATLLLVLLVGMAVQAHARAPLRFDSLSRADGLPSNYVLHMTQRADGFVWIATAGGLARYDGERIVAYVHDDHDPASLADNWAAYVFEDRRGRLWVATNGGLDRLRPDETGFDHFRHRPGDPTTLPANDVHHIAEDRAGRLWFSTSKGLVLYRGDEGFETFDPVAAGAETPRVRSVVEDADGRLWVGTESGLYQFDAADGTFTEVYPERIAGRLSVRDVLVHSSGKLWLATSDHGVFVFDPGSRTFERFAPDELVPSRGPGNEVMTLAEGPSGRVWAGSWSTGLHVIDPQTGSVENTRRIDGLDGTLPHDAVISLMVDRSGVLWVGTYDGLALNNPRDAFEIFTHVPGRYDSLSDQYVWSIAEDSSNRFWVGTEDGLNRWDSESGRFERFENRPTPREAYPVWDVTPAGDGRLWLGTGDGLERFDPDTGTFERFDMHDPALSAPVWRIIRAPDGSIWLGLESEGLVRFDPATGQVEQWSPDDADEFAVPGDDVGLVEPTGDGRLWVGTFFGLRYFDPASGRFQRLCRNDSMVSVNDAWIQSIYVDSPTLAWVGTKGDGLFRVELDEPGRPEVRLTRFGIDRGMASHDVRAVLGVHAGWLWVSTDIGLTRIDTDTLAVENFPSPLAFGGGDLIVDAGFRTSDGGFLMGTSRGLVRFRPEDVTSQVSDYAAPLAVTNVLTQHRPIQSDVPVSALDSVELTHQDSVVTFEFTTLDYTPMASRAYAYLLEGFDQDWQHIGDRTSVSFTNLDPGTYRLRIKGTNASGLWSDNTADIGVKVLPPPWRTWWAYLAYVATIVAVAWSLLSAWAKQEEAQRKLHHMANFDGLTGLPNRTLFQDRLRQAMSQAERLDSKVALLFIDLDHFKNINDSLGHNAGDELLRTIAGRLSLSVRKADTVARLGGDEFTVIMQGVHHVDGVVRVATKILEALARPVELGDQSVRVTPSVGIAIFPDDGVDEAELTRHADTAMYHAKKEGRNNFQFYTGEMNRWVMDRVQLEGKLRQGLERSEFRLHYQPKYTSRSGQMTGFEALLRWESPEEGMISPGRFVPVAEDSGLIVDIGAWVLWEACETAAKWIAEGLPLECMAVNLSARQIAEPSLVALVATVLKETGLPASRLELEITETSLLDERIAQSATLERLAAMGVRLALDDFGTGFSSLSHLRRFPIRTLKIDRSFIADLGTLPQASKMTSAIVDLAHRLDISVVAEGVEEEHQLQLLRMCGCEQVQGFLLGRPMPKEQARNLLGSLRDPATGPAVVTV